jgi:hypothetical protein
VAPRNDVQPLLDTLYPTQANLQSNQETRVRLHPQQLALLFSIFAMGARHALEWEQGEGPDDRYSLLARTCLAKGDFMTHHTICGVQTLVSHASRSMILTDASLADNGCISAVCTIDSPLLIRSDL